MNFSLIQFTQHTRVYLYVSHVVDICIYHMYNYTVWYSLCMVRIHVITHVLLPTICITCIHVIFMPTMRICMVPNIQLQLTYIYTHHLYTHDMHMYKCHMYTYDTHMYTCHMYAYTRIHNKYIYVLTTLWSCSIASSKLLFCSWWLMTFS